MDELCVIGNILWEESSGKNFEDKRYKKYVNHIKKCPICHQGLELSLQNHKKESDEYRKSSSS